MSDRRPGTLDRRTRRELLPTRYVHVVFTLPRELAPLACRTRRSSLRSPVSRQCGDASRSRPRSPTPRRRDRLLQRSAYLESETRTPPAGPLRSSRRRTVFRPQALDQVTPRILSSRQGARACFSRQVCCGPQACLPGWPTRFPWRTATACPTEDLCRLVKAAVPKRLGGLFQTALWRPRVCAPVSGSVQTHRVAISNHRLLSFADGQVTFHWRDFRSPERTEVADSNRSMNSYARVLFCTCSQNRFVRIRNFGFLANRRRTASLPLCLQLLPSRLGPQTGQDAATADGAKDLWRCPECSGPMVVLERPRSRRNPATFSTSSNRCCRMRGLSTSRMFWVSQRPPSFCVFSGNKSFLLAPHTHPLPANLPGQTTILLPRSQFCPAAQLQPTTTQASIPCNPHRARVRRRAASFKRLYRRRAGTTCRCTRSPESAPPIKH